MAKEKTTEATAASAALEASNGAQGSGEAGVPEMQGAFELPDEGRVNCWAAAIKGEILVPYVGKAGPDVMGAYMKLNGAIAEFEGTIADAGLTGIRIDTPIQTTRDVSAFKDDADG